MAGQQSAVRILDFKCSFIGFVAICSHTDDNNIVYNFVNN